MLDSNIEKKKKKTIESLESKFINIRAGRANPAMLNGINALYYGIFCNCSTKIDGNYIYKCR